MLLDVCMSNMKNYQKTADEIIEGPKVVSRILSKLPETERQRLLNELKSKAPKVFSKIRSNIFEFDDIPSIVGNGLQVLVREVDHDDLVLAIKYSSFEIRNCFFENMSANKRNATLSDMELIRTVTEDKVTSAKQRILDKIEELRTAGIIRSYSADDICV
jgi:flagellar motor switch protein FliG